MTLRITLRQLEYFVAVCDCGSIAGAAQQVNVSSPSISAAIAQLESEFGLKLFVRRHAHGLQLSQTGQLFLSAARETLDKANALGELAAHVAGSVRGDLRVGCLLTFAQIVLPRLRRGFVDQFPEVRFAQFEMDQSELFAELRAARIDVALTYDLNIPSEFAFLPLVALPPFALFAASHPLAERRHVSPRDLEGHPMVLLDLPMSADYFLSIFSSVGVRPEIVERTRDYAVMRSLVGNGFGYSVANIRPHSNHAPDGQPLSFVPLAGPVRPLNMGLVLPQGAQSRTVATFAEHARNFITNDDAFDFVAT